MKLKWYILKLDSLHQKNAKGWIQMIWEHFYVFIFFTYKTDFL